MANSCQCHVVGRERMDEVDEPGHAGAGEPAEEKRGGEEPAAAAEAEADRGGDDLGGEEQGSVVERHGAAQGGGEIVVAAAEDAQPAGENEYADAERPDREPADPGADPGRQGPGLAVPAAQGERAALEEMADHRHGRGDHGHGEVGGPVHAVDRAEGESGLFAHEAVGHQCGHHGGEQDAADEPAVEVADDLLEHEGDGGQRGVEGGGEAGGGTGGGGGTAMVDRLTGGGGEAGGDTAADLERGAFGPEAGTAADSDQAAEELQRAEAVAHQAEVLPEGEFQARDTAAAGLGAETGEQPAREGGGADHEHEAGDEELRPAQMREFDQSVSVEYMDPGLEGDRRQTGGEAVERGAEDQAGGGRQAGEEGRDRVRTHPSFFSAGAGPARGESSRSSVDCTPV